jgi:hypothetical protein
MTSRTINKVLIAQEDLALGQGAVSQTRQGVSTSVTQVDLPWIVTSLALLSALDTTKYKHCILNLSNAIRVYYYNAASAETADDYVYIDPDVGSGQWQLATDFDRLYKNMTTEDSAANIADISATVNTSDKYIAKLVWDTTNNRLMRASGTAAASVWHVIDGSATVTPS